MIFDLFLKFSSFSFISFELIFFHKETENFYINFVHVQLHLSWRDFATCQEDVWILHVLPDKF